MYGVAVAPARTDTARSMRTAETGNSTTDDDATLMLAYARGDVASFERLYGRHKGPTYRYLLRHTSNRATADELHQDLWMRVVRARERYRPEARFKTWLYALARHRLIDHYRSTGHAAAASLDDGPGDDAPLVLLDGPAAAADPLACVLDAEAGRRLLTALADVPAAQRDAFLLHVEAGLSLDEIALLTGSPAETVKSRLRYAYRRLRAALEDVS
jgi:RNA polymerase sigma factor (sigma-70 family)